MTLGPNWPNGGEIDIMEGVNALTINQASIHTANGCSLPSGDSKTLGISGTVVGGTNCAAEETGDAGCGVQSSDTSTYGTGFNKIGGGVYASAYRLSILHEELANPAPSAMERRWHQSVVLRSLLHPVGHLKQCAAAIRLGHPALILAEHGLQHDHVLL